MRLFGVMLGGVLLVAAVGGCTHSSSPSPSSSSSFVEPVRTVASAPPWTEPSAYAYVLTRGCSSALARYQVTVRDGAVANYRRLDRAEASPSASTDVDLGPVGDDGEEIEVPTLKGLLAIVRTAADDGGQVTQSFDATDGHPVKVTFDTGGGAECFSVTGYRKR
jgi:hypothetical protein